MRKVAAVLACALVWGTARAAVQTDKAIEAAAARALEGLDPTKLGDVTAVAVLPIWGDDRGHAEDMVKAGLTRRGVKVLARGRKEWDLLLGEIAWGAKREDVMDAATIQRFGKIQGCDGILYGTLRETGIQDLPTGKRAFARLSIHVAEVETGRIVWSSGLAEGEFVDRSGLLKRALESRALLIAALVIVGVCLLAWIIKRAVRPR